MKSKDPEEDDDFPVLGATAPVPAPVAAATAAAAATV